jgi:hypothetical protein
MGAFHLYAIGHPEAVDTYSPGGAAALLGLTRQRVYQLIQDGRLRAWFVFDAHAGECQDVPGNQASYVFVSAEDVQAYGATPRRPGPKPKSEPLAAA